MPSACFASTFLVKYGENSHISISIKISDL